MTGRAPAECGGAGTISAFASKDLMAVYGIVVGGAALWRLLGYRSGDAFRKAVQRGTLPVQTFAIPHRRGRFARTIDISTWLASLTAPLGLSKGGDSA